MWLRKCRQRAEQSSEEVEKNELGMAKGTTKMTQESL
jgi:hypothetical protein